MSSGWRDYSRAAATFVALPAVMSAALYAWPDAPGGLVRGGIVLTAVGVAATYVTVGVTGGLGLVSGAWTPRELVRLAATFWVWGVGVPAAIVFGVVQSASAVKAAPQLQNMLAANLDFVAFGSALYGVGLVAAVVRRRVRR